MAAQATPLALAACCLLALGHAHILPDYWGGGGGGGGSWPIPTIREQKKCNLAGRWVNELGSKMTIEAFDGAGSFVGSYMTAVSSDSKPIPPSPLHGVQQDVNARGQPTFGFTVNWLSTGSTTVFTGQCFVSSNGEETLKTMWLLRSEVATQSEDWKATKVGVNVFVRVK